LTQQQKGKKSVQFNTSWSHTSSRDVCCGNSTPLTRIWITVNKTRVLCRHIYLQAYTAAPLYTV